MLLGFPLMLTQFTLRNFSPLHIHIVKPNAKLVGFGWADALGFTMHIVVKDFISRNCISGNPKGQLILKAWDHF